MPSNSQYGFEKLPNGLIINTDDTYYKQLKALRSHKKQTAEVCDKIKSLEEELTEIKSLLLQVVNGRTDGQKSS